MTGEAFGPYRLVAPLGRGGMGEVWRAVDTRKDREVALKVLGSWLNGDPGFADRFRRESALAARAEVGPLDERHVDEEPAGASCGRGALARRRSAIFEVNIVVYASAFAPDDRILVAADAALMLGFVVARTGRVARSVG